MNQTNRWTKPSVRLAAAIIVQTISTQFTPIRTIVAQLVIFLGVAVAGYLYVQNP